MKLYVLNLELGWLVEVCNTIYIYLYIPPRSTSWFIGQDIALTTRKPLLAYCFILCGMSIIFIFFLMHFLYPEALLLKP